MTAPASRPLRRAPSDAADAPPPPRSGERPSFRQARYRRPAGATELLLVRHGESEPAVPGQPFPLTDGHGDPALASEGRVHAERVGARLVDEHIDAIYVTSLRRTVETAAPLAAATGLEPRVEADLREVGLGEWEGGLLRQKAAAGDPVFEEMRRTQRWDVIPGAEPQDEFVARITAAIQRIVARHPDERIVIVAHGGVIGQLVALTLGSPAAMQLAGVDNGSISHIVVHPDGRWHLRRYNDTGHLDGGLDRPTDPIGGDRAPDRPGGDDPGGGFSA